MENKKFKVYDTTEPYPKEGTFIACEVKNMWDYTKKVTAIETFEHWGRIQHISLYFTIYSWNEKGCWEKVKEIKNIKDYPEIVEFCKERNIKIL